MAKQPMKRPAVKAPVSPKKSTATSKPATRGGPGAKNVDLVREVKKQLKNAGTQELMNTPQDKRNEKIAIAALSMLPVGRAARGGVAVGQAANKALKSKAVVREAEKLVKNISNPKLVAKEAGKITKNSGKVKVSNKQIKKVLEEESTKSEAAKLRLMGEYDKKKYAKAEEDIYQQWRKDSRELIKNELDRPKRMDDLGDFDAKLRAAKMKDRNRKLEADKKIVEDAKKAAKADKKSKPKNSKPQEPKSQEPKPANKKPSLLEEALKNREKEGFKSELDEIKRLKEINKLNESYTGKVDSSELKAINESVRNYNARVAAYKRRWNIK
jgi:hypothetical protein